VEVAKLLLPEHGFELRVELPSQIGQAFDADVNWWVTRYGKLLPHHLDEIWTAKIE